jgi:hypothetical protein
MHIWTLPNGQLSLVGVRSIIGVIVFIIAYRSPFLPEVPRTGL